MRGVERGKKESMKYCLVASAVLAVLVAGVSAWAMMCEGIQEEAHQAYKAGEYDKAVRKSVEAMEFDPNYSAPIPFLKEVLPKAYEWHQRRSADFERAGQWGMAVEEYRVIDELVKLVAESSHRFPTMDVRPQLERLAAGSTGVPPSQ